MSMTKRGLHDYFDGFPHLAGAFDARLSGTQGVWIFCGFFGPLSASS
jgi:hypothetical protein